MGRACSTNGEKMNRYRLLVGKPEGKRPLARPRWRWVYNIKMDLAEIGWGDVDWISLAQHRDKWRSSCECGNEPADSMNCWEATEWLHNWWLLE
jgi:hypothetical protein